MSRAPMPDSARGDRPMPSSFDDDLEFWEEGRLSKLKRRLKEEPLVPLGLALTCYALYNAGASMRKGDKEATNRFFRARLYAQGFTIVCICGGAIYWQEDRAKRKHYQGLLGEKRAQEKKDAWIRELEARDREDEIERKRRSLRREAAKERRAVEAAGAGETDGRSRDVRHDTTSNKSPLEAGDLIGLMGGSRILGPAMIKWWRGYTE